VSDVAIPVPEVDVSTPSLDFGDGDEFGTGWGDSMPAAVADSATSRHHEQTLHPAGPHGPPARNRRHPGMRNRRGQSLILPEGHPGSQRQLDAGLPPCCHDRPGPPRLPRPLRNPAIPEFGETVSKAITYLVNIGLKNDGRLTSTGTFAGIPPVYEHGINTYALAEAYTLCKGFNITIPDLDKVVKKAGDIILEGQTPNKEAGSMDMAAMAVTTPSDSGRSRRSRPANTPASGMTASSEK
jgi:hypothetical protein